MTLRIAEVRNANPTWFSAADREFFGDFDYRILHTKMGKPFLVRRTAMWSDMFGLTGKVVWKLNQINQDLTLGFFVDEEFKTLDEVKQWLKPHRTFKWHPKQWIMEDRWVRK